MPTASNNLYAVDNNSGTSTSSAYTNAGKDRHLFYNYAFASAGGRDDPGDRGAA